MSRVGPKDHFWTYQPYLHFYGGYCDRCGKIRRNSDNQIIPYKQAVAKVWYGASCGMGLDAIRKEISKYLNPTELQSILHGFEPKERLVDCG